MTVTIHFGKNAFFLESIVPLEEGDEETSGPDTVDWDGLAGPGGTAGPGPPMQARRRPGPGVAGRLSQRVIRDQDALLVAVRAAVESLTAGGGVPYPGPSVYGGSDGHLSKCRERIKIGRLDEGFVVTHAKPVDKKKVEEVLKGELKAKKADLLDSVIGGVFETIGHATPGPTEVYGFDAIDGVVGFVREACSRNERQILKFAPDA